MKELDLSYPTKPKVQKSVYPQGKKKYSHHTGKEWYGIQNEK